jgi:hypothetical protein
MEKRFGSIVTRSASEGVPSDFQQAVRQELVERMPMLRTTKENSR